MLIYLLIVLLVSVVSFGIWFWIVGLFNCWLVAFVLFVLIGCCLIDFGRVVYFTLGLVVLLLVIRWFKYWFGWFASTVCGVSVYLYTICLELLAYCCSGWYVYCFVWLLLIVFCNYTCLFVCCFVCCLFDVGFVFWFVVC